MKSGMIALVLNFIFVVGIIICGYNWYVASQLCENLQKENAVLQEQTTDLKETLQKDEQSLMILQDWYTQDGYEDADSWWNGYSIKKEDLSEIRLVVENGENSAWATEDQLGRLSQIEEEAKNARSINELNILSEEFDSIVAQIQSQRDEAEAAAMAAEIATVWTAASYSTPSDGLTKQSGVNYYDGRRETYYSSNVLYHYRTNEWAVDNEGFYRTNDGYYVVAASDMAQGTTFEGSKGTCIVLDSGCSAGTTDYYVAW